MHLVTTHLLKHISHDSTTISVLWRLANLSVCALLYSASGLWMWQRLEEALVQSVWLLSLLLNVHVNLIEASPNLRKQ